MLFECSCEATQSIVADAIQYGYALRPKSNTPLAELVKTTTVVPMTDLTAKLGEELQAVPVNQLTEGSNNSLHNGWNDEVSERAAAILNRRIEIIRTTVIPAIKDVAESVTASVSSMPQGAEVQNIERYFACDMINVPNFMEDVKRNTPSTYLSPDRYASQEPKGVEGIVALLKVGNQAVDTSLGVAINHIGNDNLWLLWDSLFVERSKSTAEAYLTFDQAMMDRKNGLDNAIIVFMLSSLLKEEDSSTMKQYREGASYWISRHANTYNKEIESKVLIRERNNSNGAIQVNGVVYTEFLQQGGTAEIVLGAAADGHRFSTISEIMENQRDCLRSFNTIKSASSVENNLKLTAAFRKSLTENFMRSFKNDRNEAENAYFEKNQGDESAVIDKFEQAVANTGIRSLDDIYRVVADLMCNSRFYYMDCKCYLESIEQAAAAGLTAEEAEVEAVLKEISWFVTSMVTG